MNTTRIVPVVLSGGAGTRLWPASRPDTPKQLLPLVDDRTMLRSTLDRVAELPGRLAPIVVCSSTQESPVRSELTEAGDREALIIVEPMPRNTAPAAAVAALAAVDDPILLVMPADHVIGDLTAFQEAIAVGANAAARGHLVTFGIVPDHAATGYGYIEQGSSTGVPDGTFQLSRFVEKPNREKAAEYVADGSFLWNSGMFMFRCSVYLAELERCEGAMTQACRDAVANASHERTTEGDTLRLDADAFAASPSDSIDYAVMEKTKTGVVVPLDAGWSDVGSWASLHDIAAKDSEGNGVFGDVVHDGVAGSYLRSEGPLLTVVGISNIVAVSTPDAVLVAHMDRTEDVRKIVATLNERGRSESVRGKRTPSPWGSSERLTLTADRTVDQLTVRPGHSFTVKADAVVVLEGEARCDGATGAAGTTWAAGGGDVTVENPTDTPVIVLVVHEG